MTVLNHPDTDGATRIVWLNILEGLYMVPLIFWSDLRDFYTELSNNCYKYSKYHGTRGQNWRSGSLNPDSCKLIFQQISKFKDP